jgi:hypothetical protein
MWSIKYNPKSIRTFLSLSIEDNPESMETFPCSCVLTELGIGTGEWKLKYMS